MRALLFKLMHETTTVGRAAGIDLPEDFATELERSIDAFPPTMKASMANDLEAGRPLELDWLAGKVVACQLRLRRRSMRSLNLTERG
jgi:2-dehydropantoate 2-reductase